MCCTVGDADNCVDVPNPSQENSNNNEYGDACPPNGVDCGFDADHDGIGDAVGVESCDNCPGNA
jgi:hypothetical protein